MIRAASLDRLWAAGAGDGRGVLPDPGTEDGQPLLWGPARPRSRGLQPGHRPDVHIGEGRADQLPRNPAHSWPSAMPTRSGSTSSTPTTPAARRWRRSRSGTPMRRANSAQVRAGHPRLHLERPRWPMVRSRPTASYYFRVVAVGSRVATINLSQSADNDHHAAAASARAERSSRDHRRDRRRERGRHHDRGYDELCHDDQYGNHDEHGRSAVAGRRRPTPSRRLARRCSRRRRARSTTKSGSRSPAARTAA